MLLRNAIRVAARTAPLAATRSLVTAAPRLRKVNVAATAVVLAAGFLSITAAAAPFCLAAGGEDPATGIKFPALVDGLTFVGAGVRVKYGFVKVYAVGAYVDPAETAALKGKSDDEICAALCDPGMQKTIRIVMNRSLSVDKYMAAINEAIHPRMNGKDLDTLDKFKAMNPPGELKEGDEMVMTLKGNTMNYRSSSGGIGQIQSEAFVRALADVYFGKDAVSPPAKVATIKGIKAL